MNLHVVGGSFVRISMSDSFLSSRKVKRPATAPGAVLLEPGVMTRARKRREAWRRFFSSFSISEADWKVGRRVVRRVRWERGWPVELSVAVWGGLVRIYVRGICDTRRNDGGYVKNHV